MINENDHSNPYKQSNVKKEIIEIIMLLIICALIKTTVEILKILIIMVMVKMITLEMEKCNIVYLSKT